MTQFGVHSEVGRLRKVMVHRHELGLEGLTVRRTASRDGRRRLCRRCGTMTLRGGAVR
jgi:hypothetical protein